MRWLKREIWKAGIALAGILLFLVLMVWVPVSAVGAYEGTSGLATPGTATVQVTPTEDATVTALNKEKLEQEVQQLKNQSEPSLFDWLRGNASILLLGLGALAGFLRWLADRRGAQDKELKDRQAEREKRDEEQERWLEDRQAEREKRAEERFQAAVEGLSSEGEGAKIGAAILLRTFLRPGYEQFYTQTFDLAVAHLRLPRIPHPAADANTTLPDQSAGSYPTTLRQALITVFKESFPLARDEWIKSREDKSFDWRDSQSLDATGIQLDNAYLVKADLNRVWLRQAYLPNIDLRWAKLDSAYLRGAYLREAHLRGAYLHEADMRETNLREALMHEADLRKVRLWGADLSNADLSDTDLSGADLSRTNIEDARSLKDTDLRGVKGLTKEQLATCKAKGAIIDEDLTTSSPQSTVSTPLLLPESNDGQAPSAPSVPSSDISGNSSPSSESDSQP